MFFPERSVWENRREKTKSGFINIFRLKYKNKYIYIYVGAKISHELLLRPWNLSLVNHGGGVNALWHQFMVLLNEVLMDIYLGKIC